ncbi:MAG TPA: energy transducer TonB [Bryobacteraceae bacterium]|nr:energy transducer TonB [Bryobacteraceae bacterium]
MPESTARAERFEPQSPAMPFYIWEVAQKPVSVRISLDVIERLERDVVASFRSVSNRGSEIGGLLFGRVVPGSRPVVSVESYELVPCEYARGPLYRLADKDIETLDSVLRQRTAGDGQVLVGMFRSNTRRDLTCDPDDLALMTQRFKEADKILLLVKPFATKPAMAGLFIWEDGAIQESSHQTFPFTRSALVAENMVRAISANVPAASPAASAAEPPLAPASAESLSAKPAARAQVVPIASRRDTVAPPAPAAPPVAVPEPEHHEEDKVAPPPEPAPLRIPGSLGGAYEEPKASGRGKKLIWILGGVAVACLLLTLLVYPGLLVHRGGTPAVSSVDTSTLSLRVERAAGQLLLTWNREAETVKTATKAVLTITDGPQVENVDIDLAQLRNGSVVYSPVTSDVSFRLQVTSSDADKSKSEYVRVLGTRPSLLAPAGGDAKSAAATMPPAAAPAQTESAAPETEEPAAEPVPAAPRQSLSAKWQQPASLGQRLRPATSSELAEPPSLDRTASVSGNVPGLPGLSQAPAAPMAPPPARAAAAPARVGGQVQEATLISRRDPIYPPLAKQARVQGTVQLEARVGRDGTVKEVKVISGHPLLRQAAADAVKRWMYRPTLLNGEAVEVTTRVAVGFSMSN